MQQGGPDQRAALRFSYNDAASLPVAAAPKFIEEAWSQRARWRAVRDLSPIGLKIVEHA